jgi:UDP-N-acetylmuramate--alanine ligase
MILEAKNLRLHFAGIGGAGMAPLAEVFHGMGFRVSGCDGKSSATTDALMEKGIPVQIGHHPNHMASTVDALIVSLALPSDHPEILAAKNAGIRVVMRGEALGWLMSRHRSLAVAGTHGKSTTTGFLATILKSAQTDPTLIGGGDFQNGQSGGRVGAGPWLVAEADEFGKSFLSMTPTSAILTNVDNDHLESWGSQENLDAGFADFLNRIPFVGNLVINADDPGVQRIQSLLRGPYRTFGKSPKADYRLLAKDVRPGFAQTLDCQLPDGRPVEFNLRIPGDHNAMNALGAAALALEEGFSLAVISQGLKEFSGIRRRMEKVGDCRGAEVYDDYAHHPSEVRAALNAARELTQGNLVAIFQPHLYSRTQRLADEFGKALLNCDVLFVLPVFGSRELPIPGVQGDLIADAARTAGHARVEYLEAVRGQELKKIFAHLAPGDLCLTLGAGDVDLWAKDLVEKSL